MARVKKTVVTGVTREQMEDAFGRYASADAEVRFFQDHPLCGQYQ